MDGGRAEDISRRQTQRQRSGKTQGHLPADGIGLDGARCVGGQRRERRLGDLPGLSFSRHVFAGHAAATPTGLASRRRAGAES